MRRGRMIRWKACRQEPPQARAASASSSWIWIMDDDAARIPYGMNRVTYAIKSSQRVPYRTGRSARDTQIRLTPSTMPGKAIGMKARLSRSARPGIRDFTVIQATIDVSSMTAVADPAAREKQFVEAG